MAFRLQKLSLLIQKTFFKLNFKSSNRTTKTCYFLFSTQLWSTGTVFHFTLQVVHITWINRERHFLFDWFCPINPYRCLFPCIIYFSREQKWKSGRRGSRDQVGWHFRPFVAPTSTSKLAWSCVRRPTTEFSFWREKGTTWPAILWPSYCIKDLWSLGKSAVSVARR